MTEFTFIAAKDIHISDRNPRSRTDNYKLSMLDKIEQMGKACNKLGADGALIAGDLFNLKTPSRNSHKLNQELIRTFKKFSCPIYMIEGNHDLTNNRLDSLEDQPLGVLFADGTLKQLREEIIEKDDVKISLVGVPYKEELELSNLSLPKKNDCAAQIAVMHLYASPKGGVLFKERLYGYDELSSLGPDVFVLGHYHIDQGVKEVNGKHFVNIGAMSRGSLSSEDVDNSPSIALIKIAVDGTSVSYNIQPIKLKVKPVEEIFDLTKRKEEEMEVQKIEGFVNKLMEESTISEGEHDFEKTVKDMDIGQEIKDKVIYFIQEAVSKQ